MTTRRDINLMLAALAAAPALAGCALQEKKRTPDSMNAIDTHAHVFLHSLPMPDPRRAPAGYDATPQAYLAMLDGHAMTHGVLVQPSFLGLDNSYLLDVLRRHPARLRGIAVVAPGVADAQLDAMQAAGVAGVRLNLVGLPAPDFASAGWRALLAQLRRRRWQVEVHQLAGELRPVLGPLLDAGLDVVVDHFGRPGAAGVDDPGFRHLLTLGATGKVWVKLSGAYRNGAQGRGEATALAAMPLLLQAFGAQRLMWGSDWPHTLFERSADYAGQRALLERWVPDPQQRRAVLWDTPARLFGFAGAPVSSLKDREG